MPRKYRDIVWIEPAGPASQASVHTYEPGHRAVERYRGTLDDCEEMALAYILLGHHMIPAPGEDDSLRDLSRVPEETEEARSVGRPRLLPDTTDDARDRRIALTDAEWSRVLRYVAAIRTMPAAIAHAR